jgi:hypothetical protein
MAPTDRFPQLSALWLAARPSQLALIGLVYALGVGMAATAASGVPWARVGVGGTAVLLPAGLRPPTTVLAVGDDFVHAGASTVAWWWLALS